MWLDMSRALTASFPFQWLNEERIIQRLVELIHPREDEDVSTRALNASEPASPGALPRLWGSACCCVRGARRPFPQEDMAHRPSFCRALTQILCYE